MSIKRALLAFGTGSLGCASKCVPRWTIATVAAGWLTTKEVRALKI